MRQKQVVPKKTSNKYRPYSPTSLNFAYLAVLEDGLPVTAAADRYNVPASTLRERVVGNVDIETTTSGPPPLLSFEEETLLTDHLKVMANLGYGYTRFEIVKIASDLAISVGKRKKRLSLRWFYGLMSRWPRLDILKTRTRLADRPKATSPDTVAKYFKELKLILEKNNLLDKPQCIYNVDEIEIKNEHPPPDVVPSRAGYQTTIIGCGNALGTHIPPYFVFAGKSMQPDLLIGTSPGADGTVSDTGSSNIDIFEAYLKNHFLKFVQSRDPEESILIMYTGHASHVSLSLVTWARENKIVLFIFPANTSHCLQPLNNIACYGSFEASYRSERQRFQCQSPDATINSCIVSNLACTAYSQALSASNLTLAFQRTGIIPFNPDAVDTETLIVPSVESSLTRPVSSSNHEDQTNGEQEIVQNETGHDNTQSTSVIDKEQDAFELQGKLLLKKSLKSIHIVSGGSASEHDTCGQIKNPRPKQRNLSGKRKTTGKSTTKSPKKTYSMYSDDMLGFKPGPSFLKGEDNELTNSNNDIDDENCCVCGLFQPVELQDCISLVFTKWAQCDYKGCNHWTHLKYCCNTTMIRRNDKFVCPHHNSMDMDLVLQDKQT